MPPAIRWARRASPWSAPPPKSAAAEVRRALSLASYENAKAWQDYTDFAYFRLDVTGVYFIGGFGVMGWVSAADYAAAAPDPLADAASGHHPPHECGSRRSAAS